MPIQPNSISQGGAPGREAFFEKMQLQKQWDQQTRAAAVRMRALGERSLL